MVKLIVIGCSDSIQMALRQLNRGAVKTKARSISPQPTLRLPRFGDVSGTEERRMPQFGDFCESISTGRSQ